MVIVVLILHYNVWQLSPVTVLLTVGFCRDIKLCFIHEVLKCVCVCVSYSEPPQEAISADGGWALISVPPPAVLLRGRHEDHDNQPFLSENPPHHGLQNAHHRGEDTLRPLQLHVWLKKPEKKIVAISNLKEAAVCLSQGGKHFRQPH